MTRKKKQFLEEFNQKSVRKRSKEVHEWYSWFIIHLQVYLSGHFSTKKELKSRFSKLCWVFLCCTFYQKVDHQLASNFLVFTHFLISHFLLFFSWYINEAEAHRSEFCEWMRAFYSEVEKSCASKCKDLTQLLLIDKLNYTSIYFIERSEGQFN